MLMLSGIKLFSQCVIDAKPDVCLGDIAYFKLNNTSGKIISAYKWKYGDGNESIVAGASNLYAVAGNYTVTCEVTFTDGSNCKATHNIAVLTLPTSSFVDATGAFVCTGKNQACFQNNSAPAQSSRPLERLYVVWGDGELDAVTTGSLPAKICHTYTDAGNYKLRFEIADSRGCKNRLNTTLTVYEGIKAQVNEVPNKTCDLTTICYKNITAGKTPFPSLKWIVNNKDIGYNGDLCFIVHGDTNLDIKFAANSLNYKCPDTFKTTLVIKKDKTKLKLRLNKKKLCLSEAERLIAIADNAGDAYQVKWTVNNRTIQVQQDTFVFFNPRSLDLLPGKYVIKAEAGFKDGRNCEVSDTIEVLGPKPKITAWNNFQCGTHKKVYFIDSTQYSSGHNSWVWETPQFSDGDNYIWRRRNQNKYTNYTYTKDKWGKHLYDDTFSGNIKVTVYDSVTGCHSEEYIYVNYQSCPFKGSGYIYVCQGDSFLPMLKNYFNPRYFSLDSGKTWHNFPDVLGSQYLGSYPVTIIVPRNFPEEGQDFGDDSFRVVQTPVIWDTIHLPRRLMVQKKAVLNLSGYYTTGCKDKCAVVFKLNKQQFNKNDLLMVNWGFGSEIKKFDKDTLIDSLYYPMLRPGAGEMSLFYNKENHCSFSKDKMNITCGQELQLMYDSLACFGSNACVDAFIFAYGIPKPVLWNMNRPPKPYKLLLDSVEVTNTDRICKKINNIKTMPVRLILQDGSYCSDTLNGYIKVQKPLAGFKDISRYSYCGDIKQLFDSSRVEGSGNLSKLEYGWSFNYGKNITTKKDPYQVFNSSGSNSVKHWVKSSYGCIDSVSVTMEIRGSKPNFYIPDTLGCAPFTASFVNRSKECNNYIWEYKDPSNNTFATDTLNNVRFTYKLPGTYYPSLVGIDTIFNAVTGEAYHCVVRFPEDPDSVRTIRVLPKLKTSLQGPDTVCPHQPFTVKSLTKPDSIYDYWNLNGQRSREKAGKTFNLSLDSGKYLITLLPDYVPKKGDIVCADTAKKTIVVEHVKADFDMLRKDSNALFYFVNKSSASAVSYFWNFGDPKGGTDNTSKDKNPQHDYYPSTGEITVCLVAKNKYGCLDTVCKKFNQPYVEKILIANIFSPGLKDGLNDAFDIIIAGEYKYDLRIYNRYGAMVFHSQKDGDGYKDNANWNGKVNNTGSDCPDGTYYYEFNYSFVREPNKVKTLKGAVQLVR